MRQFYVFKRKSSAFFYVQFLDPVTNKRLPARSTHKKTRDEALAKVHEWYYSNTFIKKSKD